MGGSTLSNNTRQKSLSTQKALKIAHSNHIHNSDTNEKVAFTSVKITEI